MRKIVMIITLSISFFACFGTLNADAPPACNPCPWVR